MSLKDEIDKIIRAQREKLDARDKKSREHWEKQAERFKPMTALVKELAESVDRKYLRVRILPDSAVIDVGTLKEKDHFESDISWRVEPNYSFHSDEPIIYRNAEGQPGIRVEETEYYRLSDCHSKENRQVLQTEAEVMEYLVSKIAPKVAWYQHAESLRDGQKS